MSAPSVSSIGAGPTVWFTKNISPTLHRIREAATRYHTLASHVSPDAGYLGAAHEAFIEPHPLEPEAYPDYVLSVVRERGVAAVVGGRYVPQLAARRADFEALGCRLILASDHSDTFERCEDKARFYADFSPRLPMPETRVAHTWEELLALAGEIEARHGSACFKPARGIYGHGFRILTRGDDLGRFFAGDRLHLSYAAAELLLRGQALPPLLVMETLPGKEYSVDAVARGGELLAVVVRRKVGGLGNVQQSVAAPDLEAWVALLARDLHMDGLFNVQFKEDAGGQPKLLEVNARASGGLAISAALSGLKLGLIELRAHLEDDTTRRTFTPGRRVTDAREVLEVGLLVAPDAPTGAEAERA